MFGRALDTSSSNRRVSPSESPPMSRVSRAHAGVTNFVHVGLVVEDLDDKVRFLALLGFDCGEPAVFSGEWIHRIIGPGFRHILFAVDDVCGVVDRTREAGWDTIGEIVNYENTLLLCYVRGPEGLIVELAERLDGAPR
jgi:hypothetical protein